MTAIEILTLLEQVEKQRWNAFKEEFFKYGTEKVSVWEPSPRTRALLEGRMPPWVKVTVSAGYEHPVMDRTQWDVTVSVACGPADPLLNCTHRACILTSERRGLSAVQVEAVLLRKLIEAREKCLDAILIELRKEEAK